MKRLRWLVLGLVLLVVGTHSRAQEDSAKDAFEEVDNVAIATQLFRDGFYDRADAVLSTVDPSDEAIDPIQYWRLRGMVASRLGKYGEAADYLRRGIRSGDKEPRVYLLLAQAYGQADEWENAALTLRLAPKAVRDNPDAFLLESTAFVMIGKRYEAYETLVQARQKFPDDRKIERQQLFLLIEMGLYQEAIERARSFFANTDVGIEDQIALAQALRKGGQVQECIWMLEEALLEHPTNVEIRRELAAAYNQAGHNFISAEVLRPIAWLDPEWARQSAELYNRANKLEQAVIMNARVVDQKAKIRQRLAVLLKQEKFEEAAALDQRMVRLGLLDDESLLYALAYAQYRVSNYERSEQLLQRITDPELFRKAVALRESIEECRQEGWRCE